ncbi:hypothetical protein CERSUDRAFT_79851 [Gelatoporia subvermispora B]|uniref:Uncharacterized protein n=1 Tax=Ceriporiopsis subvermispora (strain B) TaxID=914234 RepID=M2RUW3_CERS8|nr:hypothetical protein CERSUDRAFT_79851 [Gelatoporia subvermispora B]
MHCTLAHPPTCSHATPAAAQTSAPTPVSSHTASEQSPANHNLPQCCHCGWRGAHAPTCPFK